jgi:hypothetical protein
MSKAKIGAIIVSVVLVFYFVLMGQRAWILVREPDFVPRIMGIALFVLPAHRRVDAHRRTSSSELGRRSSPASSAPRADCPSTNCPAPRAAGSSARPPIREFVKYQAEAESRARGLAVLVPALLRL